MGDKHKPGQSTNASAHFADRLAHAVRRTQTAALVGLDPRMEQLPEGLQCADDASLRDRARAYEAFCRGVVDVVAGLVPAVKPQAAFFEQLGPEGMAALKQVIDYARSKELIVILDGKRNDIGSTAEAYAQGYLGGRAESAWQVDALTVSPYLGDDSLGPFVDAARRSGSGVFVLVKTSNPGGAVFQDLVVDGRPLYRHVAKQVERAARQTAGRSGYGSVGAVVGATYPEQATELRAAMPHAWFLVPGYGSQGATASDVAGAFDERGLGAMVNSSRGIIFAYGRPPYSERFGAANWQAAVEAATRDMIGELAAHTPAGRLRQGH